MYSKRSTRADRLLHRAARRAVHRAEALARGEVLDGLVVVLLELLDPLVLPLAHFVPELLDLAF